MIPLSKTPWSFEKTRRRSINQNCERSGGNAFLNPHPLPIAKTKSPHHIVHKSPFHMVASFFHINLENNPHHFRTLPRMNELICNKHPIRNQSIFRKGPLKRPNNSRKDYLKPISKNLRQQLAHTAHIGFP